MSDVRWALMRDVPETLNACQHEFQLPSSIDLALAKAQHRQYQTILESLGVQVELLPADDRFPDCCFVEDTAVLVGDTAIITRPGAVSRRGEVDAVRQALIERGLKIVDMVETAQLDGGDVLQIGDEIYVGISRRTNRAGLELIAEVAQAHDRQVFPIEVRGALHLKTVCTELGDGAIIGSLQFLGEGCQRLSRYRLVSTDSEPDAANVSVVNGHVLVCANCPQTIEGLTLQGFTVIPVNISEFQKAEAGLTCLTLLGAH